MDLRLDKMLKQPSCITINIGVPVFWLATWCTLDTASGFSASPLPVSFISHVVFLDSRTQERSSTGRRFVLYFVFFVVFHAKKKIGLMFYILYQALTGVWCSTPVPIKDRTGTFSVPSVTYFWGFTVTGGITGIIPNGWDQLWWPNCSWSTTKSCLMETRGDGRVCGWTPKIKRAKSSTTKRFCCVDGKCKEFFSSWWFYNKKSVQLMVIL